MPQNMFIRTPFDFVNFSDPKGLFTLKKFSAETGTELHHPLPRTVFIQYAMWFAEKTEICFTPQQVADLHWEDGHYIIALQNGERLQAKNVIIAVGVGNFKYIPKLFEHLPECLVSHTSGYTDFSKFEGQKVAVISSGQSAWEAAALLTQEGSDVELVYRAQAPTYTGGRLSEWVLKFLGNVFFKLPIRLKNKFRGPSPGTIAHFLRPLVEGKVSEHAGVDLEIVSVHANGKVILRLNDGDHTYDHIFSASGFRLNVDMLPFLSKDLKQAIARDGDASSFPSLDRHFESNVSGLFFAGPFRHILMGLHFVSS